MSAPHTLGHLIGVTLLLAIVLSAHVAQGAQAHSGTIRVEVVEGSMPVAGAVVSAAGQSGTTDASGSATLTVPAGRVSVTTAKSGYERATRTLDVVAGTERTVRFAVRPRSDPSQANQAPVVATTRTGTAIDEQAVSVRTFGRPQVEEALLFTPGNIVGSLGEMSGLRLQITSPELGLTTIRTHGLRGHYTRLLSDGVPLYFDIPLGLAPVQTPAMDVERIEVITEGASAMFGANALAGVVNLLSRRPGQTWTREFLVSQSAPDATDGAVYFSSPATGSWSHSFFASGHRQREDDVDDDGWSDIPHYSRGTARERVYWDNGRGKAIWGTAGVTFEKRKGGSDIARQQLETKIADGALFATMPLGRYVLAAAGSLYVQSRVRDFEDRREHDRRQAATLEIDIRGSSTRQNWVAGLAVDWFAVRVPGDESLASGSVAPRGGVFVQDDVRVTSWLLVSGSARVDYTKGASDVLRVDDFFFSPRGSALARKGPWSARVSAGRSYFVPSALTEETDAAGYAFLSIDDPLEIETARSLSADFSYKKAGSGVTVTVFDSQIDDPAIVDRATFTLRTDDDPITSRGVEVVGTVRHAPFSVTGTYMYLRAREDGGRDVALTPQHSGGVLATAGSDRHGRIGARVSFTGTQRLDANPYRSRSEDYVLTGLFAERQFGRWRVFVNADNVSDVRQTNWDPLVRPARDVDGRWTVDAWAPLRGRAINAGIRASF